MINMKTCKYLIIGGGVTGLSFANFANKEDWILCEAANEVGGYCKSIHQDGFVWDYSGHFFHFNNLTVKKMFFDRMKNVEMVDVNKITSINYQNNKIDFPFQTNIHQLPFNEFLECLVDLVERPTKTPNNFLQMLYSKFGIAITEKFLKPYNEKLYACDLNSLDVEAMGRFFPYADLEKIILNFRNKDNQSYNSVFTYPKAGAYEFIKALLVDIDSNRILKNYKLNYVDLENKVCHFDNGKKIKFDFLISSIPFPTFLKLCRIKYDKETYTSNKVLVFNLGFDSSTDIKDHWIYFPDKKLTFYRVGFYNNIIKNDRMSLYVEVGLSENEIVNINEKLKKVLQDLKKCNIIKDQKMISMNSIIMKPAYVHIKKESIKDFKNKSDLLNKQGAYSIGRYGGWKYCSIEDNVIESMALYDKLRGIYEKDLFR